MQSRRETYLKGQTGGTTHENVDVIAQQFATDLRTQVRNLRYCPVLTEGKIVHLLSFKWDKESHIHDRDVCQLLCFALFACSTRTPLCMSTYMKVGSNLQT